MALVTKYAVYFDLLLPQIPNVRSANIDPRKYIVDRFGGEDPTDPTQGVVLVDMSMPRETGTDVGMTMPILKNPQMLPHNIMCLQMDDSLTAAPGTAGTPIEDAVNAIKAWGGYERTPAQALDLATYLFPAGSYTDEYGNVTEWTDPKLVSDIIKRDVTFTPAS